MVAIARKRSAAFEQQIHRIYELLEGSGAQVTWNDRIPDPDNASQSRQIDITIRRDDTLTLVECRQHQNRQDVQRIEGLIGRRISLKAHAAIAVSSSGFTAGALKKAKAQGVILRDLRQLTEYEIKNWGQRVRLTIYFHQYSDLELSLRFKPESIGKLDHGGARSELANYHGIQSLFNAAAQELGQLNLLGKEQSGCVSFGLRLELAGLQISGEPVLEVYFQGRASLVSQEQEIDSPAVFGFGHPGDEAANREALVETFSLGDTSIIREADRISICFDISQVQAPPLHQFRFLRVLGREEMDFEAFEIVGVPELRVSWDRMAVSICS